MRPQDAVLGTLEAACAAVLEIADRVSVSALSQLKEIVAWGAPLIKSPTVSGSEHFVCTPLPKIEARLRHFAPP